MFDLYNPHPDTHVDSLSLQHYRLYYDYEDMESEMGRFSSLTRAMPISKSTTQGSRAVRAFEIEADVKKHLKSGANCVIESFRRTFVVEKSIPPFSWKTMEVGSDSLP
ncbi:MAG: hypothetical protein R3B47_17575 [Bacteroidia bacterium]